MMAHIPDTNEAQSALWNGPPGRAWVDAQVALDRMFEPFEHMLTEAATAVPA